MRSYSLQRSLRIEDEEIKQQKEVIIMINRGISMNDRIVKDPISPTARSRQNRSVLNVSKYYSLVPGNFGIVACTLHEKRISCHIAGRMIGRFSLRERKQRSVKERCNLCCAFHRQNSEKKEEWYKRELTR